MIVKPWKSGFISVSSRLAVVAVLATIGLLAAGGIGWLGSVAKTLDSLAADLRTISGQFKV